MLLGVDTGGTFTDFVLLRDGQLQTLKVLSTPDNPTRAIIDGMAKLGLTAPAFPNLRLVHGSTVATNAALEGHGASTVYITNHGFTDVLRIGRQARRSLYDLHPVAPFDPVPETHLIGTGGRLDPAGQVVEPLTDDDLSALRAEVARLAPEAVAINLLYSYVDDRFERAIEAALADLAFVARSSFVLPEYREYERGLATWLNAWLGPVVHRYLQALAAAVAPAPVSVMQSSGGLIDAEQAGNRAVNLLLSGPAGGLAAATHLGRVCGQPDLLTFDMGGTSTDVALLQGAPRLTDEGVIGQFPVAVPMAEIHTIGAGGGSVAYVDAGGALQVGPESAGADPGPACYGRGGTRATVTDAHLLLGRLPADTRLGGSLPLDLNAARDAISALARDLTVRAPGSTANSGQLDALTAALSVEDAARGVIEIANLRMAQALRVISLERGYDPRDFALMCFGGAGGLHVCALAEALGVQRIIVPAHCGVFSALGMLMAKPSRQLVQTLNLPLEPDRLGEIEAAFAALVAAARHELELEGHDSGDIAAERSLDLRYRGQSFYLTLPWEGDPDKACRAFNQRHTHRYGHALDLPVEAVNIRTDVSVVHEQPTLPDLAPGNAATAVRQTAIIGAAGTVSAPVHERVQLTPGQRIAGPALVVEPFATTLIEEPWIAEVDAFGHLQLHQQNAAQARDSAPGD